MNTKHGSSERGSALSPVPAAARLPRALCRRMRAFSLIEVILVVAILGALVSLGAVSYYSIRNTAWDRATEARLSQMAKVGLGERVFSGNTDGFQPDASDFTGGSGGASEVYKDMTFVSATTPSSEPGEVSLAIGDSSMQEADVAYGAGDMAALASLSKSGNCSFAVMTKGGGFTSWSVETDSCMAAGALRPLGSVSAQPGAGDASGQAPAAPAPTSNATTTPATPSPTPTPPRRRPPAPRPRPRPRPPPRRLPRSP